MQIFTEGGSDTDDCITVWASDLGVCMSNILWPMMPNFYTPRGAKFRDPRVWRTALHVIRSLKPRVLINEHAKALDDRGEIQEALADYHAFCGLVLALLRFELPGQGAVALHIRRGVAEFLADPDAYGRSADHTLRPSGEA